MPIINICTNQLLNRSVGPEFSGTCPIDAPPKHFTQFFVKLNMRKVSLVVGVHSLITWTRRGKYVFEISCLVI